MVKMDIAYILCSIFLFSCMGTKSECKMNNEVLDFLNKKEYKYSVNKSDIPVIVIDSISSLNKEPFKVGDSNDIGKISFSDARLLKEGKDIYEYKRKLHFVLVNDTFCLIAYTEGGLGTHDVIDFIQYQGGFNHTRYVITNILNDTIKLERYLKSLLKPVKIE